MLIEKGCSKCGRLLPATMFNKAKWLSSGLRPDCKDCYSAFKKRMWAARPKSAVALRKAEIRELKAQGLRKCVRCEEIKPLTEENFSQCRETACRECVRKRVRQWAADNPEKAAVLQYQNCAARYASKRQRTPPWLTREHRDQMRAIYAACREATKMTGIKHHVDHVVPLVGKTVSGLHVPWNMQIIPGSENCRKSNKWNSS